MNFDHLKALVSAAKSSEHLYEEQAAAIEFTTMFGDQLIAMAEAGQEIASCLELNKTRSGANPYIIPSKVVDLAKSLEDYDKLLKGEKHQYKSEHDLIEVKPKIVIERWFNVVQSPDYGLYIEQYSTKDAAIAARQVHGDTIITKAIPFVWREP